MTKFYFYSKDYLGIIAVYADNFKEAYEKLINFIIEDADVDEEEASEIYDDYYHYVTIDKVIK